MDNFLGVLLSPIYTAIVGVIGGYTLKWWTDRWTREYERETKRLQFFKAFYDLRSLEKPEVSPEFDRRCQQLLRDTSQWMESRPTKGSHKAKFMAICMSVAAGYFVYYMIMRFLSKVPASITQLNLATDSVVIDVTRIIVGSATGWCVYHLIAPMLKEFASVLARFRLARHLNDAQW